MYNQSSTLENLNHHTVSSDEVENKGSNSASSHEFAQPTVPTGVLKGQITLVLDEAKKIEDYCAALRENADDLYLHASEI